MFGVAQHSSWLHWLAAAALVVAVAGCRDDDDNTNDDGGTVVDADNSSPDADNTMPDAAVQTPDADVGAPDANACVPGTTQCTNCVDDDEDGRIDGADPECTSAEDNDEGSFATGILGDNSDNEWQDCFFDGNSSAVDDGCTYHTCCIVDVCPPDLIGSFDPVTDCEVALTCIETCGAITPPGCDCFGCCTICVDGNCVDIFTNPAVAPDCTIDVYDDPYLCPTCTKTVACEEACNPETCILCPGQDISDLPPECGGDQQCPDGEATCAATSDCDPNEFCANGCCIPQID